MRTFDKRWRVEEHPHREGDLIAVRYFYVDGLPKREVAACQDGPRTVPRIWHNDAMAEVWCDANNPELPPQAPLELSSVQRRWLAEVATWPEGQVLRSQHSIMLVLEHHGLVTSRPEADTRGLDRFTITDKGRAALDDAKD